jgi:hypothetical protein
MKNRKLEIGVYGTVRGEGGNIPTYSENLSGDAKPTDTSGVNREAESSDASDWGGPPRSAEAGVMPVERRSPPLGWVDRQREEPDIQRKVAAFVRWHEDKVYVRF